MIKSNSLALILGFCGLSIAAHSFAANETLIAKSIIKDDTCYMIAKTMTLTDTSSNKNTAGMLFRAFAPDGDRLDVHCPNMVIKLKHNQEIFVSNLTKDDLAQCQFKEYKPESGMDNEENAVSSSQFSSIDATGKP